MFVPNSLMEARDLDLLEIYNQIPHYTQVINSWILWWHSIRLQLAHLRIWPL